MNKTNEALRRNLLDKFVDNQFPLEQLCETAVTLDVDKFRVADISPYFSLGFLTMQDLLTIAEYGLLDFQLFYAKLGRDELWSADSEAFYELAKDSVDRIVLGVLTMDELENSIGYHTKRNFDKSNSANSEELDSNDEADLRRLHVIDLFIDQASTEQLVRIYNNLNDVPFDKTVAKLMDDMFKRLESVAAQLKPLMEKSSSMNKETEPHDTKKPSVKRKTNVSGFNNYKPNFWYKQKHQFKQVNSIKPIGSMRRKILKK